MAPGYKLSPGSQVRREDFGLLFYTMKGPRLYFLGCGELLSPEFFGSGQSLAQWLAERGRAAEGKARSLAKGLHDLAGKGVLLEC